MRGALSTVFDCVTNSCGAWEEPITTAPPPKPFFLAPLLCWIPWPTLNEMYIRSISFVECLIVTKVSFGSSPFDPEWPEGRSGMVGGYFKSMLI